MKIKFVIKENSDVIKDLLYALIKILEEVMEGDEE